MFFDETANMTGENLTSLERALFCSLSRTAHLFCSGKAVARIQSLPFLNGLWYVMHIVVEEEGVYCGLEDDAIGSLQDMLQWLVERGLCPSIAAARKLIARSVWEPENVLAGTVKPAVKQFRSCRHYRRCSLPPIVIAH